MFIPAAPGHAQSGERPAIIVQDAAFNQSLPTTIVVPLTSKLAASRFPGTNTIQPDAKNGLSLPSVAMVFQLRTLDQRNCVKRIGELDAASLEDLFAILNRLTGRS